MSYHPITRDSVEAAEPLSWGTRRETRAAPRASSDDRASVPAQAPAEKQANITIEVAPDGLHIRAEYTGPLSSIPQAVERLRAAGVLELVQASATTPPAPAPVDKKRRAQRVAPAYNDAGEPCCPVHHKVLREGDYGLHCTAKARPGQVADGKGYCGLKFEE